MPYCSTTANCYRWSSVVCWSICRSRETCTNGQTDRDAI